MEDWLVVVVEPSLQNDKVGSNDSVHQSMLLGYPPGPDVAGSVFEPLRLTATFAGHAKRVINEQVDAFQESAVIYLPPLVVLPARGIENESHSRSSS